MASSSHRISFFRAYLAKSIGSLFGVVFLVLIAKYLNGFVGGNVFVFTVGYAFFFFIFSLLLNVIWVALLLVAARVFYRGKNKIKNFTYLSLLVSIVMGLVFGGKSLLEWRENMRIDDYVPYYHLVVEVFIVWVVTVCFYNVILSTEE